MRCRKTLQENVAGVCRTVVPSWQLNGGTTCRTKTAAQVLMGLFWHLHARDHLLCTVRRFKSAALSCHNLYGLQP